MQHHYRHYAQRMLAAPAGGSLALEILNESIGEVVRSSRTPCSFGALRAALRTSELHAVFQRIAIQRCPARISNAYSFFRIFLHDDPPLINHLQPIRRVWRENRFNRVPIFVSGSGYWF